MLCFEDASEIFWVVVCCRCAAHPVCVDGAGRRTRLARWSPSRKRGEPISLVWHDDFRRRAAGRLLSLSHESTQVDTESEDRRLDALFEMQGMYDDRASLYVGESASLCPLFELRILD